MKHPLLGSSLVAMNDVQLFTQYRFEATIGRLLSHKGVVAPPTPLCSTIESQGEPARLNGGTPTPPTTRMKRAPRGI